VEYLAGHSECCILWGPAECFSFRRYKSKGRSPR